ncbi:uncharacterized protein [Antedon mediterranea]|uniref:uncharacterized protein n=1 Tax=Antedon mediterranea TaxID=105859 RepID=UPI003AF93364
MKRMASNDISLLGDIDEKVLECSVCNGRLEDPKSLSSCLHSFCLKCLEKWVRTNHGKLTCPICRKEYPIPVGGLQKLAPNTFLHNLLETVKQHEQKRKVKGTSSLCVSHAQQLKMYCTKCKVPICIECTEMEHAAGDGKHELINIVTAFNAFKETSEDLKKAANESIQNIENSLKIVTKNAKELEESKEASLTDIDNQVQEMFLIIQKKADEMKKKVEANYKNEKKVNDLQITKLTKINAELNTNMSSLNHLLKSETATAMKSSEIVLNKMMDEINKSEEIKQVNTTRQINFIRNKQPFDLLKEIDIGNVVFKPLTIKVESIPTGVAKCDDDCLLVSFRKNEIHKYKQSGECTSKITLPEGVMINRMYRMKNGNIAFSDFGNKCIQVCDMNGHVIKSIGKGVLMNPWGIHIDEATNVMYVADLHINCVFMFDIINGVLKKIGTQNKEHRYSDIALTKTGKVLVSDARNHQVLLYDDKNKSMKVLINKGDEDGKVRWPKGVVVDEDDNIIIASIDKLQLFSSTSLCASHDQPLKMYCTKCKVPICIECTAMEHAAGDGKHELINIVTAFNTFNETSEDLKKAANESIQKIENVLKIVRKNAKELEESKDASLTDIDNQVQEMFLIIQKKADEMKKKVEENYENEKKVNDVQITKLKKINAELNINMSSLNQLLKSETATAMKSSEIVLNKLMDEINKSEEIKQVRTSRQINFIRNQHPIDLLKENDIGNVVLKSHTIKVEDKPRGVVKCDDDCLLVSFNTNEIHKYNQSGESIRKITLPEDVMVYRMYRMKNGNIAFSDFGNKCIQVCDMNGHVIKSIGKGVLMNPWGIHIDEANNVVYVADWHIECVFMFDINSGKQLKKIGSQKESYYCGYYDVTLTKTGKVLVAHAAQHQVLLYDDKDKSMKVLINEGVKDGKVKYPGGVVVDEDDNIIIASYHKLQLFSSDGHFIKRIDKQEDGISSPQQLCIISHNPCMVAVAHYSDSTIKMFNY